MFYRVVSFMGARDYLAKIEEGLQHHLIIGKDLTKDILLPLAYMAEKIVYLYSNNITTGRASKLVVFGNGGSCEQGKHFAMELVGRFKRQDRRSLPAVALDDAVGLTAIANDLSFRNVFSRQVEGIVNPGDIALGITTSGKSANVVYGLYSAKKKGALTMAFTGRNGLLLSEVTLKDYFQPDHVYAVPSGDTATIQEYHLFGLHRICDIVDEEIFNLDQQRK